jgi:hypothetical protein
MTYSFTLHNRGLLFHLGVDVKLNLVVDLMYTV